MGPGSRKHRSRGIASSVLAIGLLALVACGTEGQNRRTAADKIGAEAVEVVADSHGVSVSGPVRPGGTLRIRNDDSQMHMFLLARLHPGRSVDDAVKAMRSDDESAIDKVADPVGAPSAHLPPGQSVDVTTADLTPGHYLVADFYPSEGGDGTPAVFTTGPAELTVTGDPVDERARDTAFAVTARHAISGPDQLSRGRHTLVVKGLSTKDGKEITLWRLQPRDSVAAIQKTFYDVFDANDGKGLVVRGAGRRIAEHALWWVLPPDHGGELDLGVDLAPGRYALIAQDIDADRPTPSIEQITFSVR